MTVCDPVATSTLSRPGGSLCAPGGPISRLRRAFPGAVLNPVECPPELASNASASASIRLQYSEFVAPEVGEVRLTEIHGAKLAIFSLFVLPLPGVRQPIFAAEFVVFGNLLRAAVADIQSPLGAGDSILPARIEGTFPRFDPDAEETPAWCRDHFTPNALFLLNGRSAGCSAEAEAGFDDILDAFADTVRGNNAGDPGASRAWDDAIDGYKQHHIASTPGRPFLERTFGEAWTQRFLTDLAYR